MNPTIPPGTPDDSRTLSFASAILVPVTSLESKLTPSVNGVLRPAKQHNRVNQESKIKLQFNQTSQRFLEGTEFETLKLNQQLAAQ